MNLIELEDRINKTETDLIKEIQNLEKSLSINSIEKFEYYEKVSNWLHCILYLIFIAILYIVLCIKILDEKGIIEHFFSYIFCLYCLFWFYIPFIEDIHKLVYGLINKGLSKKEFLAEKIVLNKLQDNLSAIKRNKQTYYDCKNKYDEILFIKEKLVKEENHFINVKIEWQSNIFLKNKEYNEILFFNFVDFKEYEYLKEKYYTHIETNFKKYIQEVQNDIHELINFFDMVADSLSGGKTINFRCELCFDINCETVNQSFEEYLKNKRNNTEINVHEKRFRFFRSWNPKNNNGCVRPLPNKENQYVEPKKFDTQQHVKNINLGYYGELFVLTYEIEKLQNIGRSDLALKVKHTSKILGDSIGYDILSYDSKGAKKLIEVKTTSGNLSDDFYLSENEYKTMMKNHSYFIYRVFDFDLEKKFGKVREIHCSKEMNKLNIDVVKFNIEPNKLVDQTKKIKIKY